MNYVLKAQLERDQQKAKKRLTDLTEFKTVVKTAVDKYIVKKYAPLEKALEEYNGWNGIKDAYGWDMISKQKYDKLLLLHLERQEDFTANYLNEVIAFIDRQINETKESLKDTERALDKLENY